MNQTFFLTGCASGIGRHVSNRIIDRGGNLFATDVDMEALRDYADGKGWPEDRVRLCALDVRDPEAWETVFGQAVDAYGRIDVAMNIAGVLQPNWVLDVPVEEVHAQIDINLKGLIFGTRVAARHMIERRAGHIVNIASMAGMMPLAGMSVYSATKYAARAFSIAADLELRRRGVYVTAVCPDAVDTPLCDIPKDKDAAAIMFHASRMLTVENIGDLIMNKVLTKKPRTVSIPRYNGFLSHLVNVFPSLIHRAGPLLHKEGRKRHQRRAVSE